jgi:hypothetical protein
MIQRTFQWSRANKRPRRATLGLDPGGSHLQAGRAMPGLSPWCLTEVCSLSASAASAVEQPPRVSGQVISHPFIAQVGHRPDWKEAASLPRSALSERHEGLHDSCLNLFG